MQANMTGICPENEWTGSDGANFADAETNPFEPVQREVAFQEPAEMTITVNFRRIEGARGPVGEDSVQGNSAPGSTSGQWRKRVALSSVLKLSSRGPGVARMLFQKREAAERERDQ